MRLHSISGISAIDIFSVGLYRDEDIVKFCDLINNVFFPFFRRKSSISEFPLVCLSQEEFMIIEAFYRQPSSL